MALVEKGHPNLGLLGCPRYELEEGFTGVVFSGGEGIPAQVWTSKSATPRKIKSCSEVDLSQARLCESVESAHTAHDLMWTVSICEWPFARPGPHPKMAKYPSAA
jgi:3'(2'), 5'-bisphosphate nucleotidase